MTIYSFPAPARRRGSIAPLACILLVVILGMVAFAVDVSWMTMSQAELHNTADSAALAGATKIGDNYVLFSLPGQTADNQMNLADSAVSTARSAAKTYAAYNSAGAVDKLTLLDGDIEVGFTDAAGAYTAHKSGSTKYPNTVKVRMRRDPEANTSLKLYFAPVLGVHSMDLNAHAVATIYGGTIDSLKVGAANTTMMPVTYDVNHWQNFLKTGQDADGNVSTDADGNPILQIYPSIKAPGNFGLISLNDSHVGASTMSSWIHNGAAPADIQALHNSNLLPISAHDPNLWDWQGENGFKASNVMDLNEHVGKTYILPLFKPVDNTPGNYVPGTGQGSNYFYNVVELVGVKVVPSPKNNREVWLQPSLVTDPNVVLNPATTAPLGSSNSIVTALAPAKLTN